MLRLFPKQCHHACQLRLPSLGNKTFDRVCLVGMGGSGIGLEIIKLLAEAYGSKPVFLHRDYRLPSWVNRSCLVVCCSYSGNTEETLSAYDEGRKRKCLLSVVTSGGQLLHLARNDRIPSIVVPGGLPPRCAFGYLFFPLLRWMRELRLLPARPGLSRVLKIVNASVHRYLPETKPNPAQNLARQFYGRVPVLYSDARSFPAILRWKQQLAENSKVFATVGVIPEMNHNEIMAWRFPAWFVRQALAVFFTDKSAHDKIARRENFTARILGSRKIQVVKVPVSGSTLLEKLLNLIILGDWVSFYLALLNRIDPTEIEEITNLKKYLSR
mgnify:FL=1